MDAMARKKWPVRARRSSTGGSCFPRVEAVSRCPHIVAWRTEDVSSARLLATDDLTIRARQSPFCFLALVSADSAKPDFAGRPRAAPAKGQCGDQHGH